MSAISSTVRDVARGLVRDHSFHYAAGTAFRATLALFPLVLGILCVLSLLGAGERAGEVLETVAKTAAVPGKFMDALRSQLDNLQDPGPSVALAAVVAFALALWSGAAGFRTVMSALNQSLGLEEGRGLMHRFGISLGLSALTSTLAIAASLLVALGPAISELIRDAPGGSDAVFLAWRLVRWPLVVACVFFWLAITYAWAPADRRRFRVVSPGIVVAFVGWMAFALLYSWYVDRSSNQGKVYGAFADLIGFQLYVYWSALIVLLGAEVDCSVARRGTTEADAT